MQRITFVSSGALALAGFPLLASAQTPVQPLAVAPDKAGESVSYRFTANMSGQPPGPPRDGAAPPAQPRVDTITFTYVDPSHVRLSTGTGADAKTAVADRAIDGRLSGRFDRGTPFRGAIGVYNQLVAATAIAATTAAGQVKSGGIPIGPAGSIPGTLTVARSNGATNVTVDAQGPIQIRGGRGGDGPPGRGDGPGPGGPGPGGPGPEGPGPGGPEGPPPAGGSGQADAKLHAELRYVGGVLTHAQSSQAIAASGNRSFTMQWTVERI